MGQAFSSSYRFLSKRVYSKMIFVIDDDEIMAECLVNMARCEAKVFSNAIDAMAKIDDGIVPDLIFLDILLDGPDGFTFLNELVSYSDTARIPIVIVSSLDFTGRDLSNYGVVGFLNKESMVPEDVLNYVDRYCK